MRASSDCRWGLPLAVVVQASHKWGFSCCGAQAQKLWHTGLGVPRLVESSNQEQTRVPYIGRWTPKYSDHQGSPWIYFKGKVQTVAERLGMAYRRKSHNCLKFGHRQLRAWSLRFNLDGKGNTKRRHLRDTLDHLALTS